MKKDKENIYQVILISFLGLFTFCCFRDDSYNNSCVCFPCTQFVDFSFRKSACQESLAIVIFKPIFMHFNVMDVTEQMFNVHFLFLCYFPVAADGPLHNELGEKT